VSLALVTQQAKRIRPIIISNLSYSTMFSHIISQKGTILGIKKYWMQNVRFDLRHKCGQNISHST
jgi:hypothetical protein